MKSTRILVLSVSVIALASCANIPVTDNNLPTPDIKSSWSSNDQAAEPVRNGWLDEFKMDALSDFVVEVLKKNYDLKATAYRLEASGFTADASKATLYPTLGASFAASRQHMSNPSVTDNSLSLGLDAHWEADVWGRLASQRGAANADYIATRYDYEGARLSLAAQVAQTWFDVIEAQAQLALAQKTVLSYERAVRVVQSRYNRGLTTGLDLRLTISNLEASRARLAGQDDQLNQQKRRLEVLAGKFPAAQIQAAGSLPELKGDVPVGLPMNLLERRPDLQAAKARLLAAGYNSQVSNKAMLPNFSITASGNNSSTNFGDLLKFDNIFWNLVGNITQPIFQGGKLLNTAKAQEARFEAEKQVFARTLLTAFKEVEDALSSEKSLQEQVNYTSVAAENAIEAEKVALDQYGRGLIKISVLLESQRQSLNQQSQLLSIKKQLINNRIALHLALGGDFTTKEDTQTSLNYNNAKMGDANKGNAL